MRMRGRTTSTTQQIIPIIPPTAKMDSTYAPQSPDLSNFLSSPTKTQHQQLHHHHQSNPAASSTSTAAYAPRSPVIPSFTNPAVAPTSQHNLHAPYPSQPYQPFGGGAGVGTAGGGGGAAYGEVLPSDANLELDVYGNAHYMPPIPALPPQHSFHPQQQQQQAHSPQPHPQSSSPYYPHQQQHQPQSQQFQPQQPFPSFKTEGSYSSPEFKYASSPTMSSRQPRGGSGNSNAHAQTLASSAPPPPPFQQPQYKDPNPNNIEIKTKFPVARIKRIMQADEEVGKVAQVTPVAVSKALELFMIALVSGAADKAKEKGGKRVTAQHLKQVVLGSPEQFDFLAEIVGRVAEAQESSGGGDGGAGGVKKRGKKSEEGSESSAEEERKVKKGKGRRKKSDD